MRPLKAVLLQSSLVLLLAGQSAAPRPEKPVIEQTAYWAKPGSAEEVYRWRVHACDVREKIGLPRGRVFRRQGDSAALPDVMWQIEYPNEAALQHDLKVRAESPEFETVRQHMNTLISKFERGFWQPE